MKHIRSQKEFTASLDHYEEMPSAIQLEDKRINLEKEYIDKEVRTIVFQEINKLDDKLREVILLKFFDNMTYEEISAITGIPDRTIRHKLKKSFNKISLKLKKEGYI